VAWLGVRLIFPDRTMKPRTNELYYVTLTEYTGEGNRHQSRIVALASKATWPAAYARNADPARFLSIKQTDPFWITDKAAVEVML
jgi:hypothetical protein